MFVKFYKKLVLTLLEFFTLRDTLQYRYITVTTNKKCVKRFFVRLSEIKRNRQIDSKISPEISQYNYKIITDTKITGHQN